MPTAGILVVGNEILSGKVVDTNSPYLCRELRALGVDVERIVTIPDVVEVIAEHVKVMSRDYDFLFTSGGIGPTHDDLTIEGVAAAFGRSLELSESIMDIWNIIRMNSALLGMAVFPSIRIIRPQFIDDPGVHSSRCLPPCLSPGSMIRLLSGNG